MVVGSSVSSPALGGLGHLHNCLVRCLPLLFLSRVHAAHLFLSGWLPEGLTIKGTLDSKANGPVLPVSMLSAHAQSGVWMRVQLILPS